MAAHRPEREAAGRAGVAAHVPVNRQDWPRLKALFNAVVERHDTDRDVLLERLAREHPDLASELRVLVAAHDGAAQFLEEPAYAGAAAASDAGTLTVDAVPTGLLAAGEVLDHTYEIGAVIGHGGMGVVYRVRHQALARTFAAKLIHARVAHDPAFLERFTREAEALGKLKHPHIVDVTDFGIDREPTARPYLVMEYLTGQTLAEQVRSAPLAPDAALPLFEAIAAALDYAHAHGVLHLDLKPANILVVETPGGRPLPKILDFGLAQFVASASGGFDRDPEAAPVGTPAYMAPERWTGERPGPAADIYALGVLMYEVLVGRRPFEGSASEIAQHVRDAAPPAPSTLNRTVPPEMDHALLTILAKAPSARPGTARAAVELVVQADLGARQRRWRRIETPWRLGAAVAIAVVLTASSLALWRLPLVRGWEQWTVDARFALAGLRSPGPDIVLLLLDEAALQSDPLPLAQRADQFGADLQRVFDAGARAVAIDFLLPASWSRSGPFTRLVVQHADRLTLAAFSSASGAVIGPEGVQGLITATLGQDRAASLFGFVNLDQDGDGVSRRARTSYRDGEGGWRPSFAGRAAASARRRDESALAAGTDGFWIDHTVDSGRFARVSWADLETTLRARPELFRNRVVLVGADYAGSGDQAVVPNRGTVAGVVLHALITETILSEYPVRPAGTAAITSAAGVTCAVLCAMVLLSRGSAWGLAPTLSTIAVYVGGALVVFRFARVVVPMAGPVLLWGTAAAAAWWLRRHRPPFPQA
ncbi:MAG: CHASE2 domain-containing protein [Vicinamibacterales bacterium]